MLKNLLKNVVAISAVLFPVAAAQASEAKDPLAIWVAKVNQQIDVGAQPAAGDATGRAVITFRRGADGRAHDVAARSGRRPVALAGIRTIERLRNLPPLPSGLPADQRIVMNYLVRSYSDRIALEDSREEMLVSARKVNADIAAHMGVTQVASLDR